MVVEWDEDDEWGEQAEQRPPDDPPEADALDQAEEEERRQAEMEARREEARLDREAVLATRRENVRRQRMRVSQFEFSGAESPEADPGVEEMAGGLAEPEAVAPQQQQGGSPELERIAQTLEQLLGVAEEVKTLLEEIKDKEPSAGTYGA